MTAAITPSRTTPDTAALTNTDWSPSSRIPNEGGRVSFSRGRIDFTPETMDRVEAVPDLSTVMSTERRPSTRTTLVWGGEPSRTWATSPTRMTAPFTVLTGRSFSSA